MKTLKSLPVGIQTFEDIIRGRFVYIDKTAHIYELIKEKGLFFLSRPRRFGKTVLLSTLECIFLGKKSLFEELDIGQMEYSWEEYPVIRLDISEVSDENEDELKEDITELLIEAADINHIELPKKRSISMMFSSLIRLLYKKTGKKVVVLIDEYDSPIVNQLHDHKLVRKYHKILRGFYRVTKSMDEYLQFVFVTGISNFAKANMFSGLNHLHNISFSPSFATICGYTQVELESYFQDRIQLLAKQFEITVSQMLIEIKKWYNGYNFSSTTLPVYNPFSSLQFFADKQFSNYWYQTGTPSFLVKAIGNATTLEPMRFEHLTAFQNEFDTLVVEKPDILPLLFQTGYLTIKSYDEKDKIYVLGYPNHEVRESFLRSLLVFYSNDDLAASHTYRLVESIRQNDIDSLMESMKVFFANIPYDIQIPMEKYYQTIFYLILKLLGYYIDVEVKTNQGRIDAVLETKTTIYIIEFKLNGTADEALQQIEKNDYPRRYHKDNKEIILIGAQFDFEKRTLTDWKMKTTT